MIIHDKCAAFEKRIDELTEANQELRRRLLEAIEVVKFYASTQECWDEFVRSDDDGISVYLNENDISLADVIGVKGTYQANHYGKRARQVLKDIG